MVTDFGGMKDECGRVEEELSVIACVSEVTSKLERAAEWSAGL